MAKHWFPDARHWPPGTTDGTADVLAISNLLGHGQECALSGAEALVRLEGSPDLRLWCDPSQRPASEVRRPGLC